MVMALTQAWKLTRPWKLSSTVHQRPAIRLRRKLQQLGGKGTGNQRHVAQGVGRMSAPSNCAREICRSQRGRRGRGANTPDVLTLVSSCPLGRQQRRWWQRR